MADSVFDKVGGKAYIPAKAQSKCDGMVETKPTTKMSTLCVFEQRPTITGTIDLNKYRELEKNDRLDAAYGKKGGLGGVTLELGMYMALLRADPAVSKNFKHVDWSVKRAGQEVRDNNTGIWTLVEFGQENHSEKSVLMLFRHTGFINANNEQLVRIYEKGSVEDEVITHLSATVTMLLEHSK